MNRTSTLTRTAFKSKSKPKPMRQKSREKAAHEASPEGQDDLEHLRQVRLLPCCICTNFGMVQTSKTDAHHTKSGRYGNEKTPDKQAIPLCKCHHQGLRFDRDKTKIAYHQGQATWEGHYGLDTDYISGTLDAIERVTP